MPAVPLSGKKLGLEEWHSVGTSLCSYHVRCVDGSCTKHLTVKSYTVVMLLTFTLIIVSIAPHSFIPGLKPFFSAYPSHHSLPFLLQN